jgi:chaperonin GroES
MAKTKTPTIVPLGDRVLLQRVEAEAKTKGGIILPESAKEKPKEGLVVAVGKGRMLPSGGTADMSVQKGNRVIFSSYAGTEVKVDGEDYLILGEDEVLAVVG